MSRLKGIDPGRLNKRVSVMRYQETEDDLGNTVNELALVKTVWAEIKPLRGREELEYYKDTNEETFRVTMRANAVPDLNEKDVLVFRGQQYQINTIADPLMDHYYVEAQVTQKRDHDVKEGL